MRHVLCLFLCFSFSMTWATTFTPAQEQAIREEVREYLLENPEIMMEVAQRLREKQREAQTVGMREAARQRFSELFRSSSPVIGSASGKMTVVEFFDYRCHHCRTVHNTMNELMEENPDLRIVLKVYPILGEDSVFAARAALASRWQGQRLFEQFHEALINPRDRQPLSEERVLALAESVGVDVDRLQEDMRDPQWDKILRDNMQLGRELNVSATPAFFISHDPIRSDDEPHVFIGAPSKSVFEELIRGD